MPTIKMQAPYVKFEVRNIGEKEPVEMEGRAQTLRVEYKRGFSESLICVDFQLPDPRQLGMTASPFSPLYLVDYQEPRSMWKQAFERLHLAYMSIARHCGSLEAWHCNYCGVSWPLMDDSCMMCGRPRNSKKEEWCNGEDDFPITLHR